MSVGAVRTAHRRMSAREFRAYQESRPDHERWELIGGVPVMMTPPTVIHNWIAGNLDRLLNAALVLHDPTRIAVQRSGINLGTADNQYRPEPDVVVIDADQLVPGQRFVDRVYLAAEIVSGTDDEFVPGSNEPWVAIKRRLYLAHLPCLAVLIIEQNRVEVRLDLRGEGPWRTSKLTNLGEELALPEFGLRCRLADLYEGTPLHRRPTSPAAG